MVGSGSRCGRPCHTRHTSAACRGPACPHTCGRHTCGIASAHHPYSVCRRARSSLDPRKQGDGISSGRAPPSHPAPHHTHSMEGFYSVCRRACSSLDVGWGGMSAQARPPPLHPPSTQHRGAGSELTSHRVFHHGVPLARTLDLENFVHEDNPTVIERITPTRERAC